MKSRVRIGYQTGFPPFMQDQDGPAGLVIEALESAVGALAEAGVEVEWMPLTLEGQQTALAEGEVDLLAGVGITSERQRRFVFGAALVRTGGALFRLKDVGPLQRIVTPETGPLVDPTGAAFPDCELLDATDYNDALEQVLAGTADAAALNIHVGALLAEREYPGRFELPREPFVAVDLAPAYPRSHDEELRQLIDKQSATPRR